MHGKAASLKAEKTAKEIFKDRVLSKNLPEILIKKVDLDNGINILDFLSENRILASKVKQEELLLIKE